MLSLISHGDDMKLTPEQLANELNRISDESFELHQELATLNARMDTLWLELRNICKTDKETDRMLGATPDGQRATYLKYYLRGLSNKRTALIEESKNNRGNTW